MKKLLVGIVVLVLLMAGLTFFPSFQTETIYQQKIAGLDLPYPYEVELVSYERGLLESEAVGVLRLNLPEAENDPEFKPFTALQFQDRIQHGPLAMLSGKLATIETAIFFETEPDGFIELFGEGPLMLIDSEVGLSGKSFTFDVNVPERTATKDDVNIHWKGLTGAGAYDGKDMQLALRSPGMTITADDGVMELLPFHIEGDLFSHPSGQFLGEQTLAMEGLTFNLQGEEVVRAANLIMNATSDAKGSLSNGKVTYTMEALVIEGEAFAPSSLEMTFDNFDLEVLQRFQKQINELALATGQDPTMDQNAATQKMVSTLIELLAARPEMKITKLSVTTPQGMIDGTALVAISPEADLTSITPENPFPLIMAARFDCDVTAPVELLVEITAKEQQYLAYQRLSQEQGNQYPSPEEVEQMAYVMAREQLDQAQTQGFLQREGDNYRMVATFSNGQLQVNGVPIPIPLGGL